MIHDTGMLHAIVQYDDRMTQLTAISHHIKPFGFLFPIFVLL
jgi:hypothetical protein